MADGFWRIKQYSPAAKTGFVVTTIPVASDPGSDSVAASRTVPWWLHDTILDGPCLALCYPDGREEHYPWASILKAEYQPPTQEGATP